MFCILINQSNQKMKFMTSVLRKPKSLALGLRSINKRQKFFYLFILERHYGKIFINCGISYVILHCKNWSHIKLYSFITKVNVDISYVLYTKSTNKYQNLKLLLCLI